MNDDSIWHSDLGKKVLNNALNCARERGIRDAAEVVSRLGFPEGVRRILDLLEQPREEPPPAPSRLMVLGDLYTRSPQHMRDGDLWPEKASAPPFIKLSKPDEAA